MGPKADNIYTFGAGSLQMVSEPCPSRKYIPKHFQQKTAAVFAESALAGAAYYLLWYMLSSHITGAFWYLFAVERNDTCWRQACKDSGKCDINYFYCGNKHMEGYSNWEEISKGVLGSRCSIVNEDSQFNYGIYTNAISSVHLVKGLKPALSWRGSVFHTNSNFWAPTLCTSDWKYAVRVEEMRIKRHDSEQWMRHRLLPQDLRERVRRYDQYKWLDTRGVDEESLVQSLPKDLRRDIKRYLCLNLVKECHYRWSKEWIFNRGLLKEGDFCGEELLTWALDPKAGSNLPSSTRTVKALTEVEAFPLEAEELKFVASQFRRLHSRQVRHTFRFYSQQWRTWAACFIQAAWRRNLKRRAAERHRQEEAEEEEEEEALHYGKEYDDVRALVSRSDSTSRLGATILASQFAAKALRGHRLRNPSAGGLVKLQKPPEPDFTNYDSEN
ncbi:hypothetical protein SO802_005980 [Lithocarpus litseifolius]|uniref:Uncharacterized protein n=1 Tax=Lithocarpus litseifolius TaxID=425828 RepID=A0AAW2DK09_9ROSI